MNNEYGVRQGFRADQHDLRCIAFTLCVGLKSLISISFQRYVWVYAAALYQARWPKGIPALWGLLMRAGRGSLSSSGTGLGSSVMSGLRWMYLSAILQALLKVTVLAILARLLSPQDFGLVGIAFIFTSCAERVGQVGVGPALIQREDLSADEMKTGALLSVLSGTLIAGSLWIAAPFAARFFSADDVELIVKLLGFGFIIDGFAVLSDSLLQRKLRFREMMVIENVSYIGGIAGVGITLALLGAGVWSLVLSHLVMKVLRLAMLMILEPPPRGGAFRVAHVRSLLHLGVGFSLGRILNFISLQGDNFIVGRLLGVSTLGMYTRAYQLMALPAMYIGQVLERVLFPAMSKRQSSPASLAKAYRLALEVVTLAALPTSIVLYFLGPEIVITLFGVRWLDIVPVVSILSFGVFFRTAYKCSDTLVRSLGAVYQYAARQAIYASAVVSGSIIGGYLNGLEGVAVAVVGAVAVNYALLTRLAAHHLSLSFSAILEPHLPGIWVSSWVGISLTMAVPALRLFEFSALFVLLLGVVISLLVAVIALACAPSSMRASVIPYVLGRFGKAAPARCFACVEVFRTTPSPGVPRDKRL